MSDSYLHTLIPTGKKLKQVNFLCPCFTGKMDLVNPLAADDEANLRLKARYQFIKKSHPCWGTQRWGTQRWGTQRYILLRPVVAQWT